MTLAASQSMRTLAYLNVPSRRLVRTIDGDPLTFSKHVAGQHVTLGLRFLDVIAGQTVESERYVRSLRASIGYPDKRPISGTFKLQLGSGVSTGANTTPAINWNERASEIEVKLNALDAATEPIKVLSRAGSWIVFREDGGELTLEAVDNFLVPTSFARIRGYEEGGKWFYDVRLTQAPLSFTSNFDLVAPRNPYIKAVRDGGETDGGAYKWPEVQALVVPPDFRGTFQIRDPRTSAKTELLDITDGPEDIQAAIQNILAPGEMVTVSNPTTNVAHLTFGGEELMGVDLPLFEVQVFSTPPPDPTFTLDLNRREVWAALRNVEELADVPLEVTLELVENAEDVDNPEVPAKIVTTSGHTITIVPPVAWEGLAEAAGVRWIRPPGAPAHLPWNSTQTGVGQLPYLEVIGDGVTTTFQIDHNLDASILTGFALVDLATSKLIREGFEVTFDTSNSFTIEFEDPPSAHGVQVAVAAPQTLEVFLAGLEIAISQVTGLQELLDDYGSRLSELEEILPTTGVGARSTDGTIFIPIPEAWGVLHYRPSDETDPPRPPLEWSEEQGRLVSPLPRVAPYLLPAVHVSAITDPLPTSPLPTPSETAGEVWRTDGPQIITPGGLIRSSLVPDDGYVASDGRTLFEVTRPSELSNSFYPKAFDVTLFIAAVNEKQLRVGRTAEIVFNTHLQLINADCNAQWVLVVEMGDPTSEEGLVGLNLEEVAWRELSPAILHPIVVTQVLTPHFAGIRVQRTASGLQMDKMLYGTWEAADSLAKPDSANFLIRARLCRFDTENSIADRARGWVFYRLTGGIGEDAGNGVLKTEKPKITIYSS